ncbi:hypothetical protein GCM10027595_09870 [Corynebacterium nasicanis]
MCQAAAMRLATFPLPCVIGFVPHKWGDGFFNGFLVFMVPVVLFPFPVAVVQRRGLTCATIASPVFVLVASMRLFDF